MACTLESTSTVTAKKLRKRLFDTLDDVLALAEQKRHTPNATDKLKQSWSRIAISAVEAYGHLLHDCEIEDLENRLDTLEKSIMEQQRCR